VTEKKATTLFFSTKILLQFLYLGSYDNASRLELLKAQGISCILTVHTHIFILQEGLVWLGNRIGHEGEEEKEGYYAHHGTHVENDYFWFVFSLMSVSFVDHWIKIDTWGSLQAQHDLHMYFNNFFKGLVDRCLLVTSFFLRICRLF
jgi:hypothetical protein